MTQLQPPRSALVRALPHSFPECLKQHAPSQPIDFALAEKQHAEYVRLLKQVLPQVMELPADERHPDCCFIEDTAVVVGRKAAVSPLGAPAREGEEVAVRAALRDLAVETIEYTSPGAKLDGGDVLFTGRHFFVGLSRRTNEAGARELGRIFGGAYPVLTFPVAGSLHLKSVMSQFDPETLLFADGPAAQKIVDALPGEITRSFAVVRVPEAVPANVLWLGSTVLIQDGFPRSEPILTQLARSKGMKLVKLTMSELIKADGALTCCSILLT